MDKFMGEMSIISQKICLNTSAFIGVFSKWSKTFTEFSEFREFRESEKSLRHELGLV